MTVRVEFHHDDEWNENNLPFYSTVYVNGYEISSIHTGSVDQLEKSIENLVRKVLEREQSKAVAEYKQQLREMLGINA